MPGYRGTNFSIPLYCYKKILLLLKREYRFIVHSSQGTFIFWVLLWAHGVRVSCAFHHKATDWVKWNSKPVSWYGVVPLYVSCHNPATLAQFLLINLTNVPQPCAGHCRWPFGRCQLAHRLVVDLQHLHRLNLAMLRRSAEGFFSFHLSQLADDLRSLIPVYWRLSIRYKRQGNTEVYLPLWPTTGWTMGQRQCE